MNTGMPHRDQAVDRLVREHVERAIENTDAATLIDRIRATRERTEQRRRVFPTSGSGNRGGRRWSQPVAWAAMMILAATIAFVGGRHLGPHAASAAVVLRDVQSTHARRIDHCYRVQFAPDPRTWDGRNKLEGPSNSVLWTRGDRFWSDCTIADVRLKLGREADGTLWVSPSASKGFRFANDPADLPKTVSLICAVNAMSVPQLVKEVLADFDLHADPAADTADGSKRLVWARLKPNRTHPLLSDALLEINVETNVLNRLVLWMVRDGQPRGTVTYTLLESTQHGDDRYRLESHLNADAEIESQTLATSDGKETFSQPPSAVD